MKAFGLRTFVKKPVDTDLTFLEISLEKLLSKLIELLENKETKPKYPM